MEYICGIIVQPDRDFSYIMRMPPTSLILHFRLHLAVNLCILQALLQSRQLYQHPLARSSKERVDAGQNRIVLWLASYAVWLNACEIVFTQFQ